MMNTFKCWKKFTLILMSASISFSAISGNSEQDNNPEQKLVDGFLKQCFKDAKEDEVEKQDLIDYLAICVNDELEANDQQSMSYEKVVKLIKQSKAIKLPKA